MAEVTFPRFCLRLRAAGVTFRSVVAARGGGDFLEKWPLLSEKWPISEQKWPFSGILAKNRNFARISCEVRVMRTKWPLLGEKWPFFGAKMAISDIFGTKMQ